MANASHKKKTPEDPNKRKSLVPKGFRLVKDPQEKKRLLKKYPHGKREGFLKFSGSSTYVKAS
jgi:hypothetical protein